MVDVIHMNTVSQSTFLLVSAVVFEQDKCLMALNIGEHLMACHHTEAAGDIPSTKRCKYYILVLWMD